MVYFLVLVVFVKVLVVFSEIGVVLVVFGSGGSETLNPTLDFLKKSRFFYVPNSWRGSQLFVRVCHTAEEICAADQLLDYVRP